MRSNCELEDEQGQIVWDPHSGVFQEAAALRVLDLQGLTPDALYADPGRCREALYDGAATTRGPALKKTVAALGVPAELWAHWQQQHHQVHRAIEMDTPLYTDCEVARAFGRWPHEFMALDPHRARTLQMVPEAQSRKTGLCGTGQDRPTVLAQRAATQAPVPIARRKGFDRGR